LALQKQASDPLLVPLELLTAEQFRTQADPFQMKLELQKQASDPLLVPLELLTAEQLMGTTV
jgi:hypothetical protein